MIKKYFLESLLLHEIGHLIETLHNKNQSKSANIKSEKYADNQEARKTADKIKGIINK
jgi:predicted HD phosphohydrolase